MKDLTSITDPAAGSEAREARRPEAARARSGVEPMTTVNFYSVTVSSAQTPALFGSWVSFDPGSVPAAIVCLQAPRRHLVCEDAVQIPSVRRSHQPIDGVIRCGGPWGPDCNGHRGRSMPVASSGLVPSQAGSRRLRPSSTVPVIWVLPARAQRATTAEAASTRAQTERGVWRRIATNE